MYDQFRWTSPSGRRNRLTQEYEPLQPYFLMALAEEAGCKTFVDIGASVGVYSLFSTCVATVERVVAFEANPDTFTEFERNVKLNGLQDKIEAHGEAVSRTPGTITFGVMSKLSGANSVMETSIHDRSAFRKTLTVETVTLDDFFSGHAAAPLCLKMDVEGHEIDVIAGGQSTLEQNPAIVQIESYERDGEFSEEKLIELGYSRLTAIGPDHYFTNIETLTSPAGLIRVYERAIAAMIAHNHADKALALSAGDFALQVTGKPAALIRTLVKRVTWKVLGGRTRTMMPTGVRRGLLRILPEWTLAALRSLSMARARRRALDAVRSPRVGRARGHGLAGEWSFLSHPIRRVTAVST